MTRDPRPRHELHRRLVELLGAEHADTMMEALPPTAWDQLVTQEYLSDRFELFEHKLTAVFRAELASNTRAIVFSQIGTILATGSLVIAAAKLL